MICDNSELPDIALYLQDYIDIAYVMQKTVLPRIDKWAAWGIDFKREPKFTGCHDEYERYLGWLLFQGSLTFSALSKPSKAPQRKAVYFLCSAAKQMGCFQRPNWHDLQTPNRVDLSMLNGLPPERERKALQTIKRFFAINEYGRLIYEPEVIRQNHFAIFRDCRRKFST